jgi:prevent-host-death family protein
MHLMPVSEAKGKLSELVQAADAEDVVLTRHGRPAAVIMSVRRHAELVEALEDAEDALAVAEAKDEPTVPLEDVMAEHGMDYVPSDINGDELLVAPRRGGWKLYRKSASLGTYGSQDDAVSAARGYMRSGGIGSFHVLIEDENGHRAELTGEVASSKPIAS